MTKAGCAVVNGIFVVGAFVLASLPVSAQRISADTSSGATLPIRLCWLNVSAARPPR
jgi:hypothetical protein